MESPIGYIKGIIRKIITVLQWGVHPQNTTELSLQTGGRTVHYNYCDYIMAWTKTFYYQNDKKEAFLVH